MISRIDHLVVGSPTIDEGIDWAKDLFDFTPQAGGIHEGYGTHNVLLGLGPTAYLEIVARDPKQAIIPKHWIPADQVKQVKLIGWASTHQDLTCYTRQHADLLGKCASMKRQKPDGSLIHWKMSYPRFELFDGLVPFFIDWGKTRHPGQVLDEIGKITAFSLHHPEHAQLHIALKNLGLDLVTHPAEQPRISCCIELENKTVTI